VIIIQKDEETKIHQKGIQKAVFETIRNSRMAGIPYITKQEILSGVKEILPELNEPYDQVSQALYHLSISTKFRRAKIKRVKVDGVFKGWTVIDEYLKEKSVLF